MLKASSGSSRFTARVLRSNPTPNRRGCWSR